jgi:hypothetical protein
MEPRNENAPHVAATTRRAKGVVSGKPTRPYTAKQLTDKSAKARDWLARRHRVQRPRR